MINTPFAGMLKIIILSHSLLMKERGQGYFPPFLRRD
jgi:hypothetical protein